MNDWLNDLRLPGEHQLVDIRPGRVNCLGHRAGCSPSGFMVIRTAVANPVKSLRTE